MERKTAVRIFYSSIFLISVFVISFSFFTIPDAFAATSFGNDYRQLVESGPGSTADTTTTVSISSTGSYIVNPYTSGSTATGSPSTTSLSGYGWRTAALVGNNINNNAWDIVVTTQSSLVPATGTGNVKVYVYATDLMGTSVSLLGTATGTTNVFGSLTAQTETLQISNAALSSNTKVVVVEYWIDVTVAPSSSTTVTFQTNTNTHVVDPPGGAKFYLGKPSLYAVGESDSFTLSDTVSKTQNYGRGVTESITLSPSPVRILGASRSATEATQGVVADNIARTVLFPRSITESTNAVLTDSVGRVEFFNRQSSQSLTLSDAAGRVAGFSRPVTATITISDVISTMTNFVRGVSDNGSVISDGVSRTGILARSSVETTGAVVIDSVERFSILGRMADDLVNIGDVSDRLQGFTRLVSDDVLVISDNVDRIQIFLREPADILSITDDTSRIVGIMRETAETMIITDIADKTQALFRTVIDSEVFTDGIDRTQILAREATESTQAIIVDEVTRFAVMTRESVEDTGAIMVDGVERMTIMFRQATESSGSLISDMFRTVLHIFDKVPDNNRGGGGGGRSTPLVQDDTFFETSPLQKIIFRTTSILDSSGAQFNQIQVGESIQFHTVIENRQASAQEYVVIIQIVDENNVAQEILLTQGLLERGQSTTVSTGWTSDSTGIYSVGIFVVDNLDMTEPSLLLSQKVNKVVNIISQ